jgi:hypothetical protein
VEPISAFLIGLGTFAIAQDIDYKYRAAAGYYHPVPAAQAEPAYPYAPAYVYAPAPAPAPAYQAPARSPQATDQYLQRWQGFMEPVARR